MLSKQPNIPCCQSPGIGCFGGYPRDAMLSTIMIKIEIVMRNLLLLYFNKDYQSAWLIPKLPILILGVHCEPLNSSLKEFLYCSPTVIFVLCIAGYV